MLTQGVDGHNWLYIILTDRFLDQLRQFSALWNWLRQSARLIQCIVRRFPGNESPLQGWRSVAHGSDPSGACSCVFQLKKWFLLLLTVINTISGAAHTYRPITEGGMLWNNVCPVTQDTRVFAGVLCLYFLKYSLWAPGMISRALAVLTRRLRSASLDRTHFKHLPIACDAPRRDRGEGGRAYRHTSRFWGAGTSVSLTLPASFPALLLP